MIQRILLICSFILSIESTISQQSDFSVEIQGGPTKYVFSDTEESDITQDFNYTLGGYIKRNITLNKIVISLKTGYIIDNKKYKRVYTDTILSHYRTINTSYIYGNIPILFEIKYSIISNLFPFLSIGITFGHILSQKQESIKHNGEVLDGFPFESSNNKYQRDLYFSIGVDYQFTKYVFIRFEPFISNQLNKVRGYNQDRFGWLSYGIKIGIGIGFVHREKH